MKDFFDKFKIPTVLGLGIIIAGIAVGTVMVLREQTFISQASPDATAQNITVTNITDTQVTISWQTSVPTTSFVTFGITNPNEQTVLDDRDTKIPQAYSLHYVTLKNLLPKTTYQYKITSGKIQSETGKVTTATPLKLQTGFRPIVGSVLDGDKPLNEGIAYLSIANATTQSFLIKSSGNFLIPVSQIRKTDLSGSFPTAEDTVAKLTIVSANKQATAIFKLGSFDKGLPSISLGENLDLLEVSDLDKYDLNGDGRVNTTDYAIILQNAGNPPAGGPQNPKADLNSDGVVDQKDLDLMLKQINQ